jgi:hypothetical protein
VSPLRTAVVAGASGWVRPGVLLDSGFAFAHPTLPEALSAIAAQTPRGLLPVTLG